MSGGTAFFSPVQTFRERMRKCSGFSIPSSKCNVSKMLALLVTVKFEMKESLCTCACMYVTVSRARAHTLYSATPVLTI